MTKAEQLAYDIVKLQIEKEMHDIRTNPLFQEWSASNFRDMLVFGEETPETQELQKRLLESLKKKA